MADPVHQQCVEAAVAILKALALPGIGQNVLTQMLEEVAAADYPVLIVTTQGRPLTLEPLTTASRVVGYPVRLRVVDQAEPPSEGRVSEWFGWAERIADAFPDRRKAEYPAGVHGCKIADSGGIDNVRYAFQLAENEMMLVFKAERAIL